MSTMSPRLPESLHERAREVVKREGVSINQQIATALAEKLSALDTIEYLRAWAGKGSRGAFEEALGKVPAGPMVEGDELP